MTYLYITAAVIFLSLLWLIAQKYMNILVERRIATWQNDLVKRHCDEVENIYRQMRGWRHDYHNHIQTMKACLAQDRKKELSEYLDALDTDLVSVDTVLKTGNVMIDEILNSKISLARSKEISVNAKAVVPENLSIADIDLCVVLGNLLDNAIEACMKQNDKAERFIRIYIGMHKELFYLSITNSVGGDIKKQKSGQKKNIYLSTKDKEGHGLGLIRIDKIVDKYNGFIDRQNEPGVFATEVLLPLARESFWTNPLLLWILFQNMKFIPNSTKLYKIRQRFIYHTASHPVDSAMKFLYLTRAELFSMAIIKL